MIADITVILLSFAVFLALILYVALEQEQRERVTGFTFFLAALGGIIIYGFSYSRVNASLLENLAAIMHTLVDVGRMFVGVNNEEIFLSALAETGYTDPGFKLLFWVVHFLAYYSMASAVVMTLGKGAVRRLRILFLSFKDVELIYGITENSIIYGKRINSNRHASLVFAGNASPSQETAIRQMGAVLFTDDAAMTPKQSFLKQLHLRKNNRLHLSALSDSADQNFNYALRMKELLQDAKISPKNTSLTLLGREESYGADLLADKERYGYGEIKTFDSSELTARLLLQKYPLCEVVEFDDDNRAKSDVEVLVAGFRKTGQEVLKKLIANGQFEGSNFRAYVFDPKLYDVTGFFNARYSAMLDAYKVEMSADGWQSENFCNFLTEHAKSLSYIVIALDDPDLGSEIAADIIGLLIRSGRNMPIYQCYNGNVICHRKDAESMSSNLYDADILYNGQIDELAMKINHYYNSSEGTIEDKWMALDYFSRMSCRASADFFTVLLKRLNITKIDDLSNEAMENLARTEHKRWCAFHYSMGYQCMLRNEWEERALKYQRLNALGQAGNFRISKDAVNLRHACLISYDELDELSERENSITGKETNYKQLDRDNVNVIIDMLESKNKDLKRKIL